MRTYKPHQDDARAAHHVLDTIYARAFDAELDEIAALHHVVAAFEHDETVTQHCICRAHDAIDRWRSRR